MKDVVGFKCNNLTVIKGQYHKMIKGRNRLFVESICKCGNTIEHIWDIINKHIERYLPLDYLGECLY